MRSLDRIGYLDAKHPRPICLGAKRPNSGCFGHQPAAICSPGAIAQFTQSRHRRHGFSSVWAQRAQTFYALRKALKHLICSGAMRPRLFCAGLSQHFSRREFKEFTTFSANSVINHRIARAILRFAKRRSVRILTLLSICGRASSARLTNYSL